MKKIFSAILTISLGFSWSAAEAQQLQTTSAAPYNNVNFLVNNLLMGQGVSGYNISSYGAVMQRGKFWNGGTAIGLDSGLVMCSGNVTNIMTSTGSGASTAIANGTGQGAGDSDLLSVAQSVPSLINQNFSVNSTWDASIINFDFVPLSDTVQFQYVFGSDEYTTWINTSYNDVFGFFLSGPGINGSYSNNAINVATVPNTNPALPISISTIHPNLNSQYYNTGGSLHAYNGYTDVMTAILIVQACDTFHMKLGVADGSDKILDTGVFLEANSFESTGLIVQPSPSYNPFGNDTALYEGCGDVSIYFTRNDSVLPQATLSYEVYGTATMAPLNQGGDFSPIINSQNQPCVWNSNTSHWECEVFFGAGVSTDSIAFDVFNDFISEGIETIIIAIDDSIQLSCHSGDTIELTIIDQPDLIINAWGDATIDCNDDSVNIGVDVISGLPPYDYAWSTGYTTLESMDSTNELNVLPNVTTSYIASVTDGCGQQTELDIVNVGVFNVPWSSVKFGNNQTISCIDPPVTMGVGVVFNDGIWHGDITYLWGDGSTDSTITVFSTVDTNYSVTITRGCTGETVVHNFSLNTYNDPVRLSTKDVPTSAFECPGDAQNIKVSASGGYPPYAFQWSNGSIDSTTVVGPMLTDTFYVTVTDVCALVEYVDKVVVNVPVADPLVISGVVNDTVPCRNVKVHFGPAVAEGGFGWGYRFSWDKDFSVLADYTQEILFDSTAYTIYLTDGCNSDTVSKTVYGVVGDKNDLDLIVPNDTLICYGEELLLEAQAQYGAKNYDYKWNTGSKDRRIKVSPEETTTYTVRVTDFCDTIRIKEITVEVSEVIADFEFEYLNDYEVAFKNKSWSSDEILKYEWEIAKAAIFNEEENPVISLPDGEAYTTTLTATNEYGCFNIATVIVEPNFRLYIPSGFTPNNDGINDTWTIKATGIREIKLEVYDRWGGSVFVTRDKNFEWDGTLNGKRLPMGSYNWRIVLFTDDDEFVERRGAMNILNDFQDR